MTRRPVRIAVQLAPQHTPYRVIRESLDTIEELGVDIALTWDHFFPLSGEPDGLHFEAWSILAAWAEQSSRIELGVLVSATGYRNPSLLADIARTVDHISARDGTGRLILGIGSGWFERDYAEYGYDFGTVGSRLDQLAADLPVIEERWAKLNPPPTRRIPVLIGGGGERKTLRIVAKHATIWHSFSDAETLERKLGILEAHCADVGRDVGEIEISTDLRAEVLRSGDLSQALAVRELGASIFTVELRSPYDFEAVRAALAWRDEVNAALA